MRYRMLCVLLSGLPCLALAESNTVTQEDLATVVSSAPVYRQINAPRQDCWTEQVTAEGRAPVEHGYGGTILGGIAGGLLGHSVGKGGGRDAATAVGAITGAVVGDNVGNAGSREAARETRTERHCRTVDNWSQQLTGYRVSYRYNGREHAALLPYDPGSTLRVSVDITPNGPAPQIGTTGVPPPPPGMIPYPPR